MASISPPKRPLDDHGPSIDRLNFRLWQIAVSAVTILGTCWAYTLHPTLGITATFIGKHILVAVLAAGLSLPPPPERD